MPELPRPQIRTARDPGVNTIVEPTTDFFPQPTYAQLQELLIKSVTKAMKDDHMNDQSYLGQKQKYEESTHKTLKYENLKQKDPLFAQQMAKIYGSYEMFLKTVEDQSRQRNLIDPRSDKKLDVTIITQNIYYKSDHISAQEIIMEALNGICTVDYLDVSGKAQRLNGTLQKKHILGSQVGERYQFFGPLPGKYGEKIVLWNINKQKWSSFYLSNAVRFVKDDTIDLE